MSSLRELLNQSIAGVLPRLRQAPTIPHWDANIRRERPVEGRGITQQMVATSRVAAYRRLPERETRPRDRRLAGKARVRARRNTRYAERVFAGISGSKVRVPDAAPPRTNTGATS